MKEYLGNLVKIVVLGNFLISTVHCIGYLSSTPFYQEDSYYGSDFSQSNTPQYSDRNFNPVPQPYDAYYSSTQTFPRNVYSQSAGALNTHPRRNTIYLHYSPPKSLYHAFNSDYRFLQSGDKLSNYKASVDKNTDITEKGDPTLTEDIKIASTRQNIPSRYNDFNSYYSNEDYSENFGSQRLQPCIKNIPYLHFHPTSTYKIFKHPIYQTAKTYKETVIPPHQNTETPTYGSPKTHSYQNLMPTFQNTETPTYGSPKTHPYQDLMTAFQNTETSSYDSSKTYPYQNLMTTFQNTGTSTYDSSKTHPYQNLMTTFQNTETSNYGSSKTHPYQNLMTTFQNSKTENYESTETQTDQKSIPNTETPTSPYHYVINTICKPYLQSYQKNDLKSPITILPPTFPPNLEELVQKLQNLFSTYTELETQKSQTEQTTTISPSSVSTSGLNTESVHPMHSVHTTQSVLPTHSVFSAPFGEGVTESNQNEAHTSFYVEESRVNKQEIVEPTSINHGVSNVNITVRSKLPKGDDDEKTEQTTTAGVRKDNTTNDSSTTTEAIERTEDNTTSDLNTTTEATKISEETTTSGSSTTQKASKRSEDTTTNTEAEKTEETNTTESNVAGDETKVETTTPGTTQAA